MAIFNDAPLPSPSVRKLCVLLTFILVVESSPRPRASSRLYGWSMVMRSIRNIVLFYLALEVQFNLKPERLQYDGRQRQNFPPHCGLRVKQQISITYLRFVALFFSFVCSSLSGKRDVDQALSPIAPSKN
ncbi:hypothetical protein EV421DRAFT_1740342 [Armillaria borealis]|uniref:Uncharacterized protein n=1 Tax=Armillaria borealis TaxID=47425 RepID=A0AA39MI80_9AGAR|nr:hypothetical protein EV421DRAFT_1740342 [Armillaria borealis]